MENYLNYKGISPLPGDFDEFWNEEIRKADKFFKKELKYEMIKKDFGISFAECYDLYFNGTGGARIYSKLIIPKGVKDKKIPFILKFHGYQGQSSDWSRNIGIVASGIGLVMMDVRGQAGKSQDNGIFDGITVRGHIVKGVKEGRDKLFYKDVYLDTYLLSKIIEKY